MRRLLNIPYPLLLPAVLGADLGHAAEAVQPGIAGGDIATVVLGLAFVLLLIFGSAWLIKRLGAVPSAASGAIKIVAVLPVGSRERITLVEVGGKQLLLGVTPTQITTLHTFDEPVADAANPENSSEFAQKLHQLMSRN